MQIISNAQLTSERANDILGLGEAMKERDNLLKELRASRQELQEVQTSLDKKTATVNVAE